MSELANQRVSESASQQGSEAVTQWVGERGARPDSAGVETLASAIERSDKGPGERLESRPWHLTVEGVLWGAVALVAALRLLGLQAAPLSSAEAEQAMAALALARGQALSPGYSPLLTGLNGLLFFLLGPGDGLARLLPALAGTALVLTPALLRRLLGRVGALSAALALALSPTLFALSRQSDGTTLGALGVMLAAGGLAQVLAGRRSWLLAVALGLALVLTGSSASYGMLLALLLALLFALLAPRVLRGLRFLKFPVSPVSSNGQGVRGRAETQALVVAVLAVLGGATALSFNWAGLGATGDLLAAWAGRWSAPPAGTAAVSPWTALLLYEPLLLAGGLAGLVVAWYSEHPAGLFVSLWGLGSRLLLMVGMRALIPADTLGLLLPLALLTGLAIEALLVQFQREGQWINEGLYIPVAVLLLAHVGLELAHYGSAPGWGGRPVDLAMAALVLTMLLILTLGFAMLAGTRAAVRGLLAVLAVAVLAWSAAGSGQLAYQRAADPREPLLAQPASPQVYDLVHTLRDLSSRETGNALTLPVAVYGTHDASDVLLRWYLRDFQRITFAENLPTIEVAPAVIAPLDAGTAGMAGYVGQSFVLTPAWSPAEVRCTSLWPPGCEGLVRWWLFRQTATPPGPGQQVVLWVREGTAAGYRGW